MKYVPQTPQRMLTHGAPGQTHGQRSIDGGETRNGYVQNKAAQYVQCKNNELTSQREPSEPKSCSKVHGTLATPAVTLPAS